MDKKKLFYIIDIVLIFIIGTVYAIKTDYAGTKKINVVSRKMEFKNTQDIITDTGVKVGTVQTNIKDSKITAKNNDINLKSKGSIKDSKTSIKGDGSKIDNSKSKIDFSKYDFSATRTKPKNTDTKVKDASYYGLEDILYGNKNNKIASGNFKNDKLHQGKANYEREKMRAVNWNIWKSNFTNEILEKCDIAINLSKKKKGDFFYFSFDVTDEGEIKNVIVILLSEPDKTNFTNFIKSYAHSRFTDFPANTRRKSANIRAYMTFDDYDKGTTERDFNDMETYHYK